MTDEIRHSYRALELEPGASLEQVKQAWRELVKVWHPDRFLNDAKMQRKAQERLKDINRAYEILSRFLTEGTSPRGSHVNPSNAHRQEEQESKETKAGRGEPPGTPRGHDGSKPPQTPKRARTKAVYLLIFAVGVLSYCVHLAVQYCAFTKQLTTVRGIHIGDSRDEVRYRLGVPTNVLGSHLEEKEYKGFRLVYTVSAPPNDKNRMPPSTKLEDYSGWVYEEPNNKVRLTIEFNKFDLVESIDLYCDGSESYAWGPVAGIYSGDSEEKVLGLGSPSQQHIEGVSKTIAYHDIGVEVTLSKGRAYMIRIRGPQDKAAVFWRFIHR